ncbi:MAG: SulP family inorganic anion transporter, partial [Pontibacterium sp.]
MSKLLSSTQRTLKRLPINNWLLGYNKATFSSDALAAVIVTVMLIPQSLAYALLAGLPAEVGLYASILPLVAYAVFGSSRTLAVGPVAVVSLMTAAAVGSLNLPSVEAYIGAAVLLAFMSGLMLILMGLLRLGMMANFLSHPVISGFISASGIIIAASQLKHVLGVELSGHNLLDIGESLYLHATNTNVVALVVGTSTVLFLYAVRRYLKSALVNLGISAHLADIIAKAAPVIAILASICATYLLDLTASGLQVVGTVPSGLPSIALPSFDLALVQSLALSALLISIVGFVESVSVAQTLAAKRRQRISPDQELYGLGASNIASAMSGGFPVTGGFSRSVVNFDAGAQTPAAGLFTAAGIALATLFLTPFIYYLPKATLAATIIVAVLSLVDFSAFSRTWHYSRHDFASMIATFSLTLLMGVEAGIMVGVALSIALHLYHT